MGKDIICLEDEVEKWAWQRLKAEKKCPVFILKMIYKLKISLEDVKLLQDVLDLETSETQTIDTKPESGHAQEAQTTGTTSSDSEPAQVPEATDMMSNSIPLQEIQSTTDMPDLEPAPEIQTTDTTSESEHAQAIHTADTVPVSGPAQETPSTGTTIGSEPEITASNLSTAVASVEEHSRRRDTQPAKKISYSKKYDKTETTLLTTFENDTEKEQQFTFRTEKTTKDTIKITATKGLTIGGTLTFNAKSTTLPVEGGATMKIEIPISRSTDHVVENEARWCAEGAIIAPPHTKSTAYVKTTSLTHSKQFSVQTEISGTLVANVIRKRRSATECTFNDEVTEAFKRYPEITKLNFEGYYKHSQVQHRIVVRQEPIIKQAKLTGNS